MKSTKLLLAAAVLSSGMALAYEEATDQTGMTEPPRGTADNSFVEGVEPGLAETNRSQDREAERDPSASQTTSSSSQQQAQSGSLFERLDADQDKNLSKHEAREHQDLVSSFDDLDQDNDGVLSAEELENWDGLENVEQQ